MYVVSKFVWIAMSGYVFGRILREFLLCAVCVEDILADFSCFPNFAPLVVTWPVCFSSNSSQTERKTMYFSEMMKSIHSFILLYMCDNHLVALKGNWRR